MAGPAEEKPETPAAAPSGGDPPKGSVRPPAPPPPPTRQSVRPGGTKALIGRTISDRYKIERLLGEGGMGAVYEATHTLMRKRMAIKVLHPEMTRLPEVVKRFENEARASAHIDHPNVVTATDFGKLEDGSFFLALEFVGDGKSLREVIAKGPLELGRALHITRQIASGLQRAHGLGIVHRDLKPENILLVDRDGEPDFVKVLDFGIAKVPIGELSEDAPAGQVLTQAGMVYGTPEYMAPEQALGQSVDSRADLYALGIILYEMLTGVRPFEAESKVALLGMQVTAPVPRMAERSAEANVPPEVEALVARLLKKEAAERLGDAKELIEAIGGLLFHFAAVGRIDARFAPPPASGVTTSPGFVSAIAPGPPEVVRALPQSKAEKNPLGLLAGKQWIVAAGAGVAAILVLLVAILVVARGRDGKGGTANDGGVGAATAEPRKNVDPSVEEKIKEAIAKIDHGDYGSGIESLEALGPEVEDREDVGRALFTAYAAKSDDKGAIRAAKHWLKANPNLDIANEQALRTEVRDAALKDGTTTSQKGVADDAFALLENDMGSEGWDLVYDIAYGVSGTGYAKAAARARADLGRGERSKMSPALQVTLDLHAANFTCTVKNHLERAVEKGDVRTLALLRQIAQPRIVGHWKKTDLLACVHADHSADHAVAALEERLKTEKKK